MLKIFAEEKKKEGTEDERNANRMKRIKWKSKRKWNRDKKEESKTEIMD